MFDHLRDGRKIKEDYSIKDVIGTGAYGEVRLCKHLKTGVERAVKIILKESLSKSE